MAHLNWRNAPIQQSIGPHATLQSQLVIAIGSAELQQLSLELDAVFVQGLGELRVDLAQSWVLFWKRRDPESRLLLAHPNPTEWVATLALEVQHGSTLVQGLRSLSSGQSLAVSVLGPIGKVSNCELVITLL